MKITFVGTSRGQKLYAVTSGDSRFFTGTLEEVKRFVLIHNQKVMDRREQAERQTAALKGE